MLNEDAFKFIFALIPSSLMIHGSTQSIQKTIGSVPLNDVSCPTINMSITEGAPYYQSLDNCFFDDGDLRTEMDIRTAVLKFKVGATDIQNNVTQTISIEPQTNVYALNDPVLQINSVKNHFSSDYQLTNDRSAIRWLNNIPALGSTFEINYDWIDSGYWIAHNIMQFIIQNMLGNIRILLEPYNVNVLKVANVVDISKVYANQALTVFMVDVTITYPFTWTIDFSNFDDSLVTLQSLIVQLIRKNYTIPDETIIIN
jgi:hypothetical protein